MNNHSYNSGTLKISENVISEIAVNAVNETDGVCIYKTCGLLNQSPVSVRTADGAAEITVLINVKYGHKAQACAEEVQEKIKTVVQDMTGIMVSKVNVKIISLI